MSAFSFITRCFLLTYYCLYCWLQLRNVSLDFIKNSLVGLKCISILRIIFDILVNKPLSCGDYLFFLGLWLRSTVNLACFICVFQVISLLIVVPIVVIDGYLILFRKLSRIDGVLPCLIIVQLLVIDYLIFCFLNVFLAFCCRDYLLLVRIYFSR